MYKGGLAGFSDQPTQFTKSNGITVAYETFGSVQGKPLILVAGLYNQLVRWPVIFCNYLAERGFYVIRFDNRDIGLSDHMHGIAAPNLLKQALKYRFGFPVNAPYSLDDMALDTVGLLDALHIEKAHLVGMSMGGMICQIIAGAFPDRVLSLTSMMSSSGVVGKGKPSWRISYQMIKRPSGKKSQTDITVETLQMFGSPRYRVSDENIRAMVEAENKRSRNPAGYYRQLAAINTCRNRVPLLRSINTPSLIIHGKQDLLVPVDGGIDTAKHITDSKLVLFDGMGHDLPMPLLENFAELITDNSQNAEVSE